MFLSPLLFNVYVNMFSECLTIRSNVNGIHVNGMLYTKDMIMCYLCIFSMSTIVVKLCNDYCEKHGLIFHDK